MSAARSDAQEELRRWASVRKYREQAIRYLEITRTTGDPGAQNRFIEVAEHYRSLADADAEERDAESRAEERRSRTSDT